MSLLSRWKGYVGRKGGKGAYMKEQVEHEDKELEERQRQAIEKQERRKAYGAMYAEEYRKKVRQEVRAELAPKAKGGGGWRGVARGLASDFTKAGKHSGKPAAYNPFGGTGTSKFAQPLSAPVPDPFGMTKRKKKKGKTITIRVS